MFDDDFDHEPFILRPQNRLPRSAEDRVERSIEQLEAALINLSSAVASLEIIVELPKELAQVARLQRMTKATYHQVSEARHRQANKGGFTLTDPWN